MPDIRECTWNMGSVSLLASDDQSVQKVVPGVPDMMPKEFQTPEKCPPSISEVCGSGLMSDTCMEYQIFWIPTRSRVFLVGNIPIFTLTGFNVPQMAEEWQSQDSTLVTPSGARFVVAGNCTQQKWIVETDQIGEWGPPEWVVQLEGSGCDLTTQNKVFSYQCHREFQSVPAEAGIYQLHQPGKTLHFEVLAGENDLVKPRKHPLIGPHVVKKDHKERVMLTPIRSLKEARLDLTGLNISQVVPECAPYITTSHEGWKHWLNIWYVKQLAKSHQIQGLDTILGHQAWRLASWMQLT
ncbi:UNVERIFIED_CONTAM: hypothetical protein K2H54_000556 [Gekko kuhli]